MSAAKAKTRRTKLALSDESVRPGRGRGSKRPDPVEPSACDPAGRRRVVWRILRNRHDLIRSLDEMSDMIKEIETRLDAVHTIHNLQTDGDEDMRGADAWAAGLIIREAASTAQSLGQFVQEMMGELNKDHAGILAIEDDGTDRLSDAERYRTAMHLIDNLPSNVRELIHLRHPGELQDQEEHTADILAGGVSYAITEMHNRPSCSVLALAEAAVHVARQIVRDEEAAVRS